MQALSSNPSVLSTSYSIISKRGCSPSSATTPSHSAPMCTILSSHHHLYKQLRFSSAITAKNERKRGTNIIRATSTVQKEDQGGVEVKDVQKENQGDQKEVLGVNARVKHITSIEEFDEALVAAKKKLVVVEYAATHSLNSRNIYPSMVDLSQSLRGVVFLLVLGDESDATRELCERAGIKKVPHFVFYKHSQKIHEEEGITSDVLEGDVLYYGDNDAPIHQVACKADFETLLQEHASDQQLVVLDIGLKSCGPCAKVYPTFVKLAKRMVGSAVFARMHGDENEECKELIKSMGVVEVPTFLFIRDGKPLGRYVGSGRGELVGEILRHNGVRVTY